MAAKIHKRKSGRPVAKQQSTNSHDVYIRIIDGVLGLINSGNIIALILLWMMAQTSYISYKVDKSFVEDFILRLIEYDYFYILPMSVFLAISVAANFWQWKTYESHIKQHIELRKELMHGIKSGTHTPLDGHNSSGLDIYTENNRNDY